MGAVKTRANAHCCIALRLYDTSTDIVKKVILQLYTSVALVLTLQRYNFFPFHQIFFQKNFHSSLVTRHLSLKKPPVYCLFRQYTPLFLPILTPCIVCLDNTRPLTTNHFLIEHHQPSFFGYGVFYSCSLAFFPSCKHIDPLALE